MKKKDPHIPITERQSTGKPRWYCTPGLAMAITMSAEMKHPMTLAMKVCCHVMPVAINEAAAFHPVVPNADVNQNMASPYLGRVSLCNGAVR